MTTRRIDRALQGGREPPRAAMRRTGSLALLAAGALLLGTAPALAQAGAAATVRFATHDGYARLVLDLPRLIPFSAALEGGRLVLRFADAVTPETGAALARLEGYLRNPQTSADHKVLSFDLVRPVVIRSFGNQKSAVIDLVDQPNAPAPVLAPPVPGMVALGQPTPPVAAPVAAAAIPVPPPAPVGPRVPVRIGSHDAYTRLVFDWPVGTDYKFANDGGVVQFAFNRPGQVDIAGARPNLPRAIGALDALDRPDGVTIAMTVPPTATVRHFRNGNSVVVDVIAPPTTAAATELPASIRPPAPAVAAPPVAAAVAAPVVAPAQPAPQAVPAPLAATPVPAVVAPAVGLPVAAPPAITAPALPGAPPPTVPAPLAAPPAVAQAPVAPAAAAPPPAAPAVPAVAPAPADPELVAITAADTPVGLQLRFPFRTLPAAALFIRGGDAMLVFDTPASFDSTAVRNGVPSRTGKPGSRVPSPVPEPVAVTQGAALRLPIGAAINPQFARDGEAWVLSLRAGARRAGVPAPINVDGEGAGGPRVIINVADPGTPIQVPDPESGGALTVVPVKAAGSGVEANRQFAQFSLLPSLQGVAVLPSADGVQVLNVANGVLIQARQGLVLSPEATGRTIGSRVFDLEHWLDPGIKFVDTQQALERAVVEADPAQRPLARFEEAQFFLARDHWADALGLSELIANEGPSYAGDPAVKAIRGTARLMMGDGAAAATDLGDAALADDPAVMPLRAGALALQGKWAEADKLFRQGGPIKGYTPTIRQRLGLLAAEAALETGDAARARSLLDGLRDGLLDQYQGRYDYLRARMLIAGGDKARGLDLAQRLTDSADPWSRAHGEFLLTQTKLADGTMKPNEAIDRLDRLRFAWSGDRLQFDILRTLGDLQLKQGQFRAGLNRLREAVNFFPDEPESKGIRSRMVDTFVDLYSDKSQGTVPPLTALALFDDFRDLTPPGPRGDQMVQNLADRLVAIDLLDRAEALLDYQIKNRLGGVDRARVGARLAIVNLLDRNPQGALTALAGSEDQGVPADLANERRLIKVRALLEAKNYDGAIDELKADGSTAADELRAEIYSRSKQWPKAAEVLQRLTGAPGSGPLTDARQKVVMNLAVATAMSKDVDGLRRVRDQFGDLMAKTPSAAAFGLVTSVGQAGPSVDTVADSLKDLQQFQSYMADYRQRLRQTADPGPAAAPGAAPGRAAPPPPAIASPVPGTPTAATN